MELLDDNGMDAESIDRNLDFPIVYSNGKTGQASLTRPEDGTSPDSPDLGPLVKTLLDTIPAPTYDAEEPLRAQVTNLDASPYLGRDRKSTRLNSSHANISYAVFCLKKKKKY